MVSLNLSVQHKHSVYWTPSCDWKWSFCLYVLPSGSFHGIGSWVFPETQHGVMGPFLLCVTGPDFFKKNLFVPKMGKVGQKQGFLNLLENVAITFFWIWSMKKFYNVCCILAQSPYLGKIYFLRYEPKCSWPIRLQYF